MEYRGKLGREGESEEREQNGVEDYREIVSITYLAYQGCLRRYRLL